MHEFERPFTSAQGPFVLSQFDFAYAEPHSADLSVAQFLRDSIDLFKSKASLSQPDHQICFVISDGLLNKKLVKPLCMEAEDNNILYVFIILDNQGTLYTLQNNQSPISRVSYRTRTH